MTNRIRTPFSKKSLRAISYATFSAALITLFGCSGDGWNLSINLNFPGNSSTPATGCNGSYSKSITVTADPSFSDPTAKLFQTDVVSIGWAGEAQGDGSGTISYSMSNSPDTPPGTWTTNNHAIAANQCASGVDSDPSLTYQALAKQNGITGPPYYLWVQGNTSAGGLTSQAFPLNFFDDGLPPTITINPSSGKYATSNAPGINILVNDDSPIIDGAFSLNFTGPGTCPYSGPTGTLSGMNPSAQVDFTSFAANCGPGIYVLASSATDNGNFSTAPVITADYLTYTVVDVTPRNLTGVTQSDKAVLYKWDPPPAGVDHYLLVMNDPSVQSAAMVVSTPLAPTATGYYADYTNLSLPPWWSQAAINAANLSGNAPYGTNLLSSATLRGCWDVACAAFSDSNDSLNSTFADSPLSPSVTPFASSATIRWDSGLNLFPPPSSSSNSSPPFIASKGTKYQISYSADNFTTSKSFPGSSVEPFLASPQPLIPNSPYQYYITATNGDGVVSAPTPTKSFWTLPAAPEDTPFNPVVGITSITVSFNYPTAPNNNPPATPYYLQASIDDFVTIASSSPYLPQGAGTSGTGTVSGLIPATTYAVRACAYSLNPAANHITDDACGTALTGQLTHNIVPTAFSGVAKSTTVIAYTWTPPPALIDHYDLMMNDPSGINAPFPVNKSIPGSAKSYSQDYSPSVALPSWMAAWGTNLLSSATLKACFYPEAPTSPDPDCSRVSGTSNPPDSHYTWANPATSPAATVITATSTIITWSAGTNLFFDSNFPQVNGTRYVISSTNLVTGAITGGFKTPADATQTFLPLVSLIPNTLNSYTINAVNGDQTHSTPLDSATSPFWTLPAAPGMPSSNYTLVPGSTAATITANFTFPSNPSNPLYTQYQMQASPADPNNPGVFTLPPAFVSPLSTQVPPITVTTTSVSGLVLGTTYLVRACALSSDSSHNTPDGCSASIIVVSPFAPPNGPVGAPNHAGDATSSSFLVTIPTPRLAPIPNPNPPPAVEIQYTSGYGASAVTSSLVYGLAALPAEDQPTLTAPYYSVPISGVLLSNTSFYTLQARYGSSTTSPNLDNDQSASVWSPLDPSAIAWTKPNAPGNAPQVPAATITNTSLGANFFFPTNPAYTTYDLEATPANNPTNAPIKSAPISQGTGTSSNILLSGLSSGTPYILQVRAISSHDPQDSSLSFDTFSPTQTVTTNIDPGTILSITPTSIMAAWKLSNDAQTGVNHLLASATQGDGSSPGTSETPDPSAAPQIQVTLLTSNTSYSLTLQHVDNDGLGGFKQASTYPGSQTPVVLTSAAVPSVPALDAHGPAPAGLYLQLTMGSDTNSPDSLYAMKITLPSGLTGFLTGASTGTAAVAVSSSPVWMTPAQWSSGQANQILGVTPDADYQAQVAVLQKADGQVLYSPAFPRHTPGSVRVLSYNITSGATLDNIAFGVPADATLTALFNVPIDTNTIAGKITLLSATGSSHLQSAPFTWGVSGASLTITLTNAPAGQNWAYNTAYQVNLAAGVSDLFGFQTAASTGSFFVTLPPPGAPASVISPLDPTLSTVVDMPASALPTGGFIAPRVQFLSPASPVSGAPASALGIEQQGLIQVFAKAEVDIYRCPGCSPAAADSALMLKLSPPASQAGLFSRYDKSTIGLYRLGSSGELVLVPNSTVNADGSVSAPITDSALYFLAGAVPTQLSGVIAYPVPYKTAMGNTITFKNLAADSTIKIFTIMGELVGQLQSNGIGDPVPWDVKNRYGEAVASGVYIYQVKNAYSEKRGKLIIIR